MPPYESFSRRRIIMRTFDPRSAGVVKSFNASKPHADCLQPLSPELSALARLLTPQNAATDDPYVMTAGYAVALAVLVAAGLRPCTGKKFAVYLSAPSHA